MYPPKNTGQLANNRLNKLAKSFLRLLNALKKKSQYSQSTRSRIYVGY